MAFLRRLVRLPLLIGMLFAGLTITFVVFPFVARPAHQWWIRHWSGLLLRCAGVRPVVREVAPMPGDVQSAGGLLLVANHVSWLDIFLINQLAASRFVAKSEIARWPVAGMLVARVGTLFIERHRRRAVQHMLHEVARHLEAGEIVAVFPEGTTSDGLALLPFHGNLMQAAIHVDCPIQPVAIRFLDLHGQRSEAPLFIGETTFVESAWNILGAPGVIAELHWLEPIAASSGQRRSELSALARERIAKALSVPLAEASLSR